MTYNKEYYAKNREKYRMWGNAYNARHRLQIRDKNYLSYKIKAYCMDTTPDQDMQWFREFLVDENMKQIVKDQIGNY